MFILTGGTLGDLYGRRRIFVLGVAVFAIGTLVCAIAPSGGVLVLGRGVAGLGAALELPVALAILNLTYPDAAKRARAIAIWGGMNGLAMAIGPTVGGILVDTFGWRSLFWAILPVAATTGALGMIRVPETSDPHGRGLDVPGQVFAIVTLAALCIGFIEGPKWGFATWPILACFTLFLIGLCGFLVVEHYSPSPLVPLAILRERAFSASLVDASLMTFGMYGLLFVLPLFLRRAGNARRHRASSDVGDLLHCFADCREQRQCVGPARGHLSWHDAHWHRTAHPRRDWRFGRLLADCRRAVPRGHWAWIDYRPDRNGRGRQRARGALWHVVGPGQCRSYGGRYLGGRVPRPYVWSAHGRSCEKCAALDEHELHDWRGVAILGRGDRAHLGTP